MLNAHSKHLPSDNTYANVFYWDSCRQQLWIHSQLIDLLAEEKIFIIQPHIYAICYNESIVKMIKESWLPTAIGKLPLQKEIGDKRVFAIAVYRALGLLDNFIEGKYSLLFTMMIWY